jgi:hypothetical protein
MADAIEKIRLFINKGAMYNRFHLPTTVAPAEERAELVPKI